MSFSRKFIDQTAMQIDFLQIAVIVLNNVLKAFKDIEELTMKLLFESLYKDTKKCF